MAAKKTVSSSRASEVRGKAIDKLDAKEFRERFCIPNNVAIELLNGRVLVPSEKAEEKTIIFSKEQFNAGLRFPLPALFKEFLHFTQIPPVFIHPNIVRHVRTPALPPTGDGAARFDKGRGDGTRGGPGCMGGAFGASGEAFLPNYSLVVPGRSGIEGPPCGLGGKGVFWLSQQIVRDRRQGEAVQDAADRAEPDGGRPGAPRICHQHSPQEDAKGVVPGEHYTVKDFPIYEALKEADAKKRRLLLEDREKKKNEGTLRKAPGQKRRRLSSKENSSEKEEAGEEKWEGREGAHSSHGICSSAHYSRGGAVARLANLAEEAASVNHPDSRNPDADAAEAVCATPMEEVGAESQSQPSDDPDRLALVLVTGPPSKKPRSVRNLRSGLLGRLQERQQEIEVAPGEVHPAVNVEVAPGDVHPAVNVEVPNPEQESSSLASSEGNPVNDASCTSASPFSYAELEEKLKQIPPGLPLVKPSAQMFEMVETLVSGLRGMANQYDLFTDLLRTTDYMKAFATRRKDAEDQQLRTEVSIEKKQREDLQLRLVAQKEELEREFAAEREEIEAEYQKQVDDTFIFGYRCCMKKNGIKRDVPSIPPGEEKKLHDKPAP
ncbi:hypothetical protein CK203_056072 [Vitis vinifera]|uniref:Uncharacterized protein n=1 Tax=Vitis vinifera TaxID=29760 RepID=A0A438G954_VITVI|nr:hypothetical protein CK203_056072 [Vitis vinifera]